MKLLFSIMLLLAAVSTRAQQSPNIQAQCFEAVASQSAVSDLFTTLGLFQTRLTPVQLFNDAYASAKDSGAAQAFLDGLSACGLHPSNQATKIWRGFAAGNLTYGETSMLLYKTVGARRQATDRS